MDSAKTRIATREKGASCLQPASTEVPAKDCLVSLWWFCIGSEAVFVQPYIARQQITPESACGGAAPASSGELQIAPAGKKLSSAAGARRVGSTGLLSLAERAPRRLLAARTERGAMAMFAGRCTHTLPASAITSALVASQIHRPACATLAPAVLANTRFQRPTRAGQAV